MRPCSRTCFFDFLNYGLKTQTLFGSESGRGHSDAPRNTGSTIDGYCDFVAKSVACSINGLGELILIVHLAVFQWTVIGGRLCRRLIDTDDEVWVKTHCLQMCWRDATTVGNPDVATANLSSQRSGNSTESASGGTVRIESVVPLDELSVSSGILYHIVAASKQLLHGEMALGVYWAVTQNKPQCSGYLYWQLVKVFTKRDTAHIRVRYLSQGQLLDPTRSLA